eukprot:4648895-Ditylum_brightwellii.AAC.1
MPIVFLLNWTAEKWRHPIPPANLDPKAMAQGKLRWYPRHHTNSTTVNDVQSREYVMLLMRTV